MHSHDKLLWTLEDLYREWCRDKANADVAEMWRFKEYVEDVAARGADTVHRDPKWRDYLGLSSEEDRSNG
jgi:hypothetical protein